MASFNKIILIGNLTRDPEIRQLPSGQNTCRLSIATNRQFTNKQTGNLTQEVCFIDVDVWGAQVESCRQFLQKGKQVLIEGRLKYDQWEDAQGQKKNKHSVIAESVKFLGLPPRTDESSALSADEDFDATKFVERNLENKDKVKGAAKKTTESKKNNNGSVETPNFSAGEIDYTDTPPFGNNEPPF